MKSRSCFEESTQLIFESAKDIRVAAEGQFTGFVVLQIGLYSPGL